MDKNKHAHDLLTQIIAIENKRLHDLVALAADRVNIADRIDQDSTDISLDLQTGNLLGALSDAARAARYAIAQKIILKGGEDPGWGR